MKHPRLRFSLKLLLLVVAALSCWLGYVAYWAGVRRDALAAITEFEGYAQPPETSAPAWLVDLIGPEYFCRIESVSGLYRKMSDEHLAVLARVPELTHVGTNREWAGSLIATFAISGNFGGGDAALITDAGMAHVARMKNLQSLVLFGTAVTDDGMTHLAGLRHLESLSIGSDAITDGSIPHLSQLKMLRRLWLGGTAITPEGAEELRQASPDCEIYWGIDEGVMF